MDEQPKPATDELAKTKKSLTISRWSNIVTVLAMVLLLIYVDHSKKTPAPPDVTSSLIQNELGGMWCRYEAQESDGFLAMCYRMEEPKNHYQVFHVVSIAGVTKSRPVAQ